MTHFTGTCMQYQASISFAFIVNSYLVWLYKYQEFALLRHLLGSQCNETLYPVAWIFWQGVAYGALFTTMDQLHAQHE